MRSWGERQREEKFQAKNFITQKPCKTSNQSNPTRPRGERLDIGYWKWLEEEEEEENRKSKVWFLKKKTLFPCKFFAFPWFRVGGSRGGEKGCRGVDWILLNLSVCPYFIPFSTVWDLKVEREEKDGSLWLGFGGASGHSTKGKLSPLLHFFIPILQWGN